MPNDPHESVLPDEERQRIRVEETYRFHVREALQQASGAEPKKNRAWAFLNSSFGLWLFSAIFVTGAGALYANYQNVERERAQKEEIRRLEETRVRELTQRINLEISYRLSLAMSRLEAAHRAFGDRGNARSRRALVDATKLMTVPASEQAPPLFPEFRQYSALALIAELRRHLPYGDQEVLKGVLANLTGLVNRVQGGSSASTDTPKNVAGELVGLMSSDRWNNGFYYTDCTHAEPFC